MSTQLQSRNGRPIFGKLYVEVATLMRQRIVSGVWKAGEKLMPLDALARTFAVSLVTVRQAVAILEQEKLLERRHGVGTFVSQAVSARRWLHFESNWMSLVDFGENSKARILKTVRPVGGVTLSEEEGTPAPRYHCMRRLHSIDGEPYGIVNIYLDRRIYKKAPRRFSEEMVIRVLHFLPDVEIERGRQSLTIGTADLETAELLQIAVNAPVGTVRRVLLDRNGFAIYVGEATYRGDSVMLVTEIKG
jgi:GntR family transcriptional regulator